jgi:hypothetical protein
LIPIKRGAAGACLALFSLVTATTALAGPRIVNGLNTQGFPTTGALLYSFGGAITSANASSQCSGTLIGCSTFLTAAHCVEDDTVANHYWVYLQNGGLSTVSSVTHHPGYAGDSGRDVAIVKLASPVTGIDPTTINSTHDLDALGVGLDGTIAGFGQTSGSGNDYGIKRYGNVVTADCDTGETGGEGNDVLVCWNYASPVGPAGEDSNTCNGDSGGPLFMEFSGEVEVVGVTSAGSSANCLPLDHSWDASVFHNAAWINGQLGADSTSACGAIPPVGDPTVIEHHHSGTLGAGNTSDSFEVVVSGTPSVLRFTLNGTDNGTFNPNFFVKQGPGASTSVFDCKADGATVFGACEFTSPAAGTWSVFVARGAGSGQYQVTTTVFGGDPPVCGNDTTEYGEECDGSDDSACPGLCLGGCTCPAPVCGNGIVESGEECDGADDSACPGECDGSCSCSATCSTGDLYGWVFAADAKRFLYKAELLDPMGIYGDLDPRQGFALEVVDGADSVDVSIPANDAGWAKSDPVRGRYRFKGDGSIDGIRRVKFQYRGASWSVLLKGKAVPGAGSITPLNVLDFRLSVDGTCHLETW